MGKRGGVLRRCLKCRVKDDKQKRRPELVRRRNARQRERKYYIKTGAAKRGYTFDLDDATFRAMIRMPCFYCGAAPDPSNGIDRMDNFKDYTRDNCVPCCGMCNMMKKCLDAATFIRRCRHIAGHSTDDEAWIDRRSVPFASYKQAAARRGLPFELTRDEFQTVCRGDCAYCQRPSSGTHLNGVDRVNSMEGYTPSNCVTCCAECNQMKAAVHADDFRAKCAQVARAWHGRDVPHMETTCVRCVTKRRARIISGVKA